jgi:carboxyl-terminal processing protease
LGTRAGCWVALPLAAALALGGCAQRLLPTEPTRTPVTAEALRRVQAMYLYPERIDRDLLVGALDALEQRFDSVRFDYDGVAPEGQLQVGEASAAVPLAWRFESRRFLTTLGQALSFVGTHLREPLEPDEDLELIALRGALAQLDPYSTIFSGSSSEDFRIRFSGTLSGIGARVGRRDGHLIAISVFPDGPAAAAGLQDGDWIVTVDGEPTQPLSVVEVVERLRGETGTRVRLGIQRDEQSLELEVVRARVNVPSVETRDLGEGVGYASISSVSRTTEAEFRAKLAALGKLQGLVLDLRSNSGGSMDVARQLADAFMDSDLIVQTVARGNQRSEMYATPRVLFRAPTVVLVDAQTASAAEIMAGALEPLESVTVLGQTTYGKGLIQQVVPLPGERLLKLTVAEYRLSQDRAVNDVGIVPEVRLAPIPAARFGQLARVTDDDIAYVRAPGEDDDFPIEAAQLLLTLERDEALEAIRARADRQIAEVLARHEIAWAPLEQLPDPLPQPLQVAHEVSALRGGEATVLEVRVTNPNAFEIPHAWALLDAPAPYLSEKIASLGSLRAGQTGVARLELTPPEGFTVRAHPATLYIGAGRRWLSSSELEFTVAAQPPRIELELRRSAPSEVQVVVINSGERGTGPILIGVPGAVRALETLPAGERREVSLALSAAPRELSVSLSGPWARRRIDVPIPAEGAGALRVVPPSVEVERELHRGAERVAVHARDPVGLRDGWIGVNGQKQAYAPWRGRAEGGLSAPLDNPPPPPPHMGDGLVVEVKVNASSGVSVYDAHQLRGDYLEVVSGEP